MMVYRLIAKIPILSTIVKIINAYVYAGDVRAMDRFAPARAWLKAIVFPLLVAASITGVLLHGSCNFPYWSEYVFDIHGSIFSTLNRISPSFSAIASPLNSPGNLVSSVYPNLLGFGIGVYALIFALSPKSLQFLHEHISHQINTSQRKQGSVLMLNASMAYPLIVITVSFLPAVFQQMYPSSQWLIVFTWIVFWYGIVVLIELIGVLFSLGEQDALDKLDA